MGRSGQGVSRPRHAAGTHTRLLENRGSPTQIGGRWTALRADCSPPARQHAACVLSSSAHSCSLRGTYRRGTQVMVATSNRAPDKLYLNGIQRQSFLPFIADLKARCEVHDLESQTDYRMLAQVSRGARTYLHPLGEGTTKQLDALFADLTVRAGGGGRGKAGCVQCVLTLVREIEECSARRVCSQCNAYLRPAACVGDGDCWALIAACASIKSSDRSSPRRARRRIEAHRWLGASGSCARVRGLEVGGVRPGARNERAAKEADWCARKADWVGIWGGRRGHRKRSEEEVRGRGQRKRSQEEVTGRGHRIESARARAIAGGPPRLCADAAAAWARGAGASGGRRRGALLFQPALRPAARRRGLPGHRLRLPHRLRRERAAAHAQRGQPGETRSRAPPARAWARAA
eukprot:3250874-Pleurochrysis_carterae.AAC.7